ncbi:MAG: hypothetical protein KKA63_00545 [Gammaproteobacteria bacterium]|nr:hypothetical protein [Gammaproteobacteria bacterium]
MNQLNRWISRAFATTFFLILTSGLAQAAPAASSPESLKGLTWLQAQVQTTGTLANEPLSIATPLQDRSEALQTLKLLAAPPTALADLLAVDTEINTEYLARRAATLGRVVDQL